jgi:hypothetical protein
VAWATDEGATAGAGGAAVAAAAAAHIGQQQLDQAEGDMIIEWKLAPLQLQHDPAQQQQQQQQQ